MKYCKDCKFFIISPEAKILYKSSDLISTQLEISYMNKNNGYPFCHAPQNTKQIVDLKYGNYTLPKQTSTVKLRYINWFFNLFYNYCGKEGRWFEQKEEQKQK